MFPLDRLDDLSLLQVLSTLPLRELAAVRCTCQRAYRLGADDRLWQRHLQQQLGAAVQVGLLPHDLISHRRNCNAAQASFPPSTPRVAAQDP